jgi:acetylornithine deacetylase
VECARGSLNQIPPYCTFSGDIRLTPFYDIKDLKAKVERYDDLSRLMDNHS